MPQDKPLWLIAVEVYAIQKAIRDNNYHARPYIIDVYFDTGYTGTIDTDEFMQILDKPKPKWLNSIIVRRVAPWLIDNWYYWRVGNYLRLQEDIVAYLRQKATTERKLELMTPGFMMPGHYRP